MRYGDLYRSVGMDNNDLNQMRTSLETKNPRYVQLLTLHASAPHDWNKIHELIFAYLLDKAGIPLEYERQFVADNHKSVDFSVTDGEIITAFELVRINFTPTLVERMSTVARKCFGAVITNNNCNPEMDTAGQLIRLQEKLCEKADKFPCHQDTLIAVVVADCTEVQLEMFDESDARTVMLGRATQPELQERFRGRRIKGLYESEHNFAKSNCFRDRIDAVLFIRSIRSGDYRPILAIQPGTPSRKCACLIAQLKQVPEYRGLRVF